MTNQALQAPTLYHAYHVHQEFKKIVEILDKPIGEVGGLVEGLDEVRIWVPIGKVILSIDQGGLIARIGRSISINHDSENGSMEIKILGGDEEVDVVVTSGVAVKVVVWVNTIVITLKLAYVSQGTRVIINRFRSESNNNPG